MPPIKRDSDNNNNNNNHDNDGCKKPKPGGYQLLTLGEIRDAILALMERVPSSDDENLEHDAQIYTWAATLEAVIEEFNLLACCISAATYQWGSDRSGAADQSLSLLSGELEASQEQINTRVMPKLSSILAPVVDLVVDKSISTTTKNNENHVKTKQHVYTQKVVDPSFSELCFTILKRNAKMIRQVVLANFFKVATCIEDYLQAQEKEHSHGSFAY
jgi:hypothetical protein